jgi:hypothetical protein
MNDAIIAGNDTTNVSGNVTPNDMKYIIEGNKDMPHVIYDIVMCSFATCAPATLAICIIISAMAAINKILTPSMLWIFDIPNIFKNNTMLIGNPKSPII